MSAEQRQLEAGMRALEAQRALLGDGVVEASLAALRARLAALASPAPPPPAEPAQTLRQVSILFLDVVGSTQLSQRLDAEATSAVMDDTLARGAAIVAAHGGKVLQYAGDNILAAFGAEASTEDDAERAVHCGLALLELGRVLGAEVQAAHGHAGFDLRVGIHTGDVLLGGGVDAEGSIRGKAVNIAARMEQTAPAGGLRISNDTYAQVRGLFEVQVQAPLAVKGVDAPVQSWLVLRAKSRQFRIRTRGIEGVATRMIGRDAELEALQGAHRRLFAERRLAFVTVVGDAGIGKSRLLYEFEAWSEAHPDSVFLFRGRATPATGTQAFGLLRDIVAWRLQIADDDRIETARRKMEDGIVPLFLHDDGPDLAEGHAHLLGHLIGIDWGDSRHIRGILDDPGQIRSRAFHTAAQMFRRISRSDGSPVILQLEDLHWADDESLDFLLHLAEVCQDVPMLVLGFTRPTLFERRKDWGRLEALHTRIELRPLGPDQGSELAAELLKKLPEVPAVLRELLTGSAEGNPFYMEELVRMLIDQGAIETGETWRIDAGKLLFTRVPPTLTGVLQARLDGLPAPEKNALQQASIVGAVFWDQALAEVDAEAAEHLPALVQRELALPRADAELEGLREYAFRQQVLHQVTYDTVLRRHKRAGHARVARWLAGLSGGAHLRAGDVPGLAAEHFERAGDGAQAAEFHARAAEQAGRRLAHERVLQHVDRALALLGEVQPPEVRNELHWRLLSARENSLDLQGRRDEQAADLDALAQLAERAGDDRRRAEVAHRRALRALRMADWTAMEGAARQGMADAARAGDESLRLHALRLLASARMKQGHTEAAQALARQALAEARSLGLRGVEARLLNLLAIAAEQQGDPLGSLELDRENLLIFRELGDRINEAIGLLNQGESWMRLGQLTQGRQHLEQALQLLRANGDRAIEGAALSSLSTLTLWQGDAAGALALARSALEIAVSAGAPHVEALARIAMGSAELAAGRLSAARPPFRELLRRSREIDAPLQHDASAGLACAALAEGDVDAALAELQPVLRHVAGGGTLDDTHCPRLIELTVHQVLARAGDPRAAEWLRRAHGALMTQAAGIAQPDGDPALRLGFLQHLPHHREILRAWAQGTAGAP